MNFQGCTTIHRLWGRSFTYNNSEILSFTFWIDMNFQDCSTITDCWDIQFSTVILKSHLLRFGC